MKKLLLPLVLLLVGVGGGVGAGLALQPPTGPGSELAAPCGVLAEGETTEHASAEADEHGEAGGHGEADGHGAPAEGGHGAPAPEASGQGEGGSGGHGGEAGHEYVRLPNQFIVPLVEEGEVAGLMLVSLSLEVAAGTEEEVAPIEPKLRDAFLRVLFDHANTGGFDGVFTASGAMRPLRAALLRAAGEASGGLVTDVLIVEMVREDR